MVTKKPDIERMQSKGRQGERRTTQIHVRLTGEEKKKLDALAAEYGADLSEYIRARALGATPRQSGKATGERAVLLETLGNLGKGLSNLNQIARSLNRGGMDDADSIEAAITEIRALGKTIREILIHGYSGAVTR